MTVAVQLAGCSARGADVVAAVQVHLGNVRDRLGPVVLRLQDLQLGNGTHRLLGQGRGRVGHGRVVQEDAHLVAGIVLLVAEGVLDLGLRVVGSRGEVVGAHGDGHIAVELDLVVVEDDIFPALATVDREACILVVPVVDHRAAHEVGHRLIGSRSEGVLGCLCRLEEHVRVPITVQLAGCSAGGADVVAAVQVHLGNVLDRGGPIGLGL